MRYYLNNQEVQVEVMPSFVECLDETISNATVILKNNKEPLPYAPMLSFVIKDNNNNVIYNFVVSNDMVEVVSSKPKLFKHKLTLKERKSILDKHLIRNTVFSTPLQSERFALPLASSSVLTFKPDYLLEGYSPTSNKDITPTINMKGRTISQLDLEINFYQYVSTGKALFSYDVAVDQQITYFQKTTHDEIKLYRPKNWFDMYTFNYDSAIQDTNSKFPTIVMTHTSGATKKIIPDNNPLNGSYIRLNADQLNWVNSFKDGIITFGLEKYNNCILNNDYFKNVAYKTATQHGKFSYLSSIEIAVKVNSVVNNVYDTIDTLLKQYMQETDTYNSSNDTTIKALFKLPTPTHNSELYSLLKNTSTPNLVFTQSTMFGALSEIFKLFDATFVIDKDNYLNIRYYNEQAKTTLVDKVGRSSNQTDDKFGNNLIAYYQKAKVIDKYPNSNNPTATAPINSTSLGVPNEDDFVFKTPKPIDIVNNLYVSTPTSLLNFKRQLQASVISGTTHNIEYIQPYMSGEDNLINISRYVVENSLYSLLPQVEDIEGRIGKDYDKITMSNALSYKTGGNVIEIGSTYINKYDYKQSIIRNAIRCALCCRFGIGSDLDTNYFESLTENTIQLKDVRFKCEYIAIVDGRLSIESITNKYKGEILSNQSNGSIDLNKLGINMGGLNLKLGEPNLSINLKMVKYEDRVKVGQYFIDNDNNKWVANLVNYVYINDNVIQQTIQFVKNFNGLATRIQLNQEKRLSNISNELTTKCEDNYNEYVYYYTNLYMGSAIPEIIALKDNFIKNYLLMGVGEQMPSFSQRGGLSSGYIKNVSNLDGFLKADFSNNNLLEFQCFVVAKEGNTLTLCDSSVVGSDTPTLALEMGDNQDSIVFNANENVFEKNISGVSYNIPLRTGIKVLGIKLNKDTPVFGAISEIQVLPKPSAFNFNNILINYESGAYRVEYASITPKDIKGNNYYDYSDNIIGYVACPLVCYTSGNSICYEMSMEHPLSGGNQLLSDYKGWWSKWWLEILGKIKYFARPVLYANIEGYADQYDIKFEYLMENLTQFYPKLVRDYDDNQLQSINLGGLSGYKYYKKPNEIFALNYQLQFLPMPDRIHTDFVSNHFIDLMGFHNEINETELYLYYGNEEYSILDLYATGNKVKVSYITFDKSIANKLTITFSIDTTINANAWAIGDYKGNLYISSNNVLNGATSVSITFLTRHHRF